MSITDELREYAHDCCARIDDDIHAIADRIDAEHQKAIRELNNLAAASVLLPVDADGVPIHAGDALTDGKHTYTVTSVTFDSFAVTVCGHSETSLNSWPMDQPGKMRHHHAPTIEDVLTEFAAKLIERSGLTNGAAQTITEYAAKLRLAEGEDA